MPSFRHTKIVATLGPASDKPDVLHALIEKGVDVVRLNFSHGDHEEKARAIALVRDVSKAAGRPVAILQDLQGPKIRVGLLANGSVQLAENSRVLITPDRGNSGDAGMFSTSYDALAGAVRPGDPIFLDDGLLELRVSQIRGDGVEAEVVKGGMLSSHKGVNLPGADLELGPLTEKDVVDLRFGLAHDVDLVALSFVRRPMDARLVHEIMSDCGKTVPVIAKIEKREALARLLPVLRAFDGVMVARGDLGVELAPEKVPAAQKTIIAQARMLRKPVITATQMLESMTHNPRPTRAEASDVANAVIDGSDAVMLSGETAVGAYPVQTVEAMDRIIREAEAIPLPEDQVLLDSRSDVQAVCAAAVHLAAELGATALTALTRSGQTAQTLSSLRPAIPIFAFLVQDQALAQRLCLWRGVVPFVVNESINPGATMAVIERELRQRELVRHGDEVVVVGAAPGSPAGRTNFIRLLRL